MATSAPAVEAATWRRLALFPLFLAAAQCLALALLGVMLLHKHRSLLEDLTLSRLEVQAGNLEAALATGARAGLRPEEMDRLADLATAMARDDPAVAAVEVFTLDNGQARVVFADRPERRGALLAEAEWRPLTAGRGFLRVGGFEAPGLGTAVRDGADEAVGGLLLRAAPAPLARQAEAMQATLLPAFWGALLLMLAPTLAAVAWLGRRPLPPARLRSRLMAAALAATLAAGGLLTWQARQAFAAGLAPEVRHKVADVAGFVAAKAGRAAALGIPLDRLPGVADYFAALLAAHPEVAALRLADGRGATLAERREGGEPQEWLRVPVGGDAALGHVEAATAAGFVAHRLSELAADVAVLLLVALLVFREVLTALLGALPGAAGAAARPESLRLPLFLFILTEELSRAFLPLYLKGFAADAAGMIGAETAVSLPIAVYMLCFAVATPFAGRWADRWGADRVFALGAGLAVAGFAWTALCGAYWQLLPARALCAFGYATGTMACQRQLIALTGAGERARGLALFVGAVGIAAVCGAALGGLLADRLGYRPVFAFSALLALLALGSFRLAGRAAAAAERVPPLRWREIAGLLRNRRFAALMLGSAIPAKIALAGFLFYLTPLALHQEGYTPAAIGRAMLAYFVLVAAVNPLASYLSDRFHWRLSLTLAGGTLIGLGGLAGFVGGETAILAAIVALGVGTGLASAPMQALASEIGEKAGATSVAVILRTIERLGSVAGPLWAGAWLAAHAYGGAMAAIGVLVLAGTLLCLAAAERRAA